LKDVIEAMKRLLQIFFLIGIVFYAVSFSVEAQSLDNIDDTNITQNDCRGTCLEDVELLDKCKTGPIVKEVVENDLEQSSEQNDGQ